MRGLGHGHGKCTLLRTHSILCKTRELNSPTTLQSSREQTRPARLEASDPVYTETLDRNDKIRIMLSSRYELFSRLAWFGLTKPVWKWVKRRAIAVTCEEKVKGLFRQAMGSCIIITKETHSQVDSALCGKAVRVRIPDTVQIEGTIYAEQRQTTRSALPFPQLYIVIRQGTPCRLPSPK